MAAVFPNIMTAFLGQAVITEYYAKIERKRVDIPNYNGQLPLLSVYVIDNDVRGGAGDSKAAFGASYTFVAAAKLDATTKQDEQIANLVDVIQSAADQFTYSNVAGYSAEIVLGSWATDEQSNDRGPGKVWVEIPIELLYRRTA